ncbi:hypothetical protein KC366_g104 [Hortaea werneckii]|nr:hypothetical protein KC366_g104 [Hortaea werneckii]
MSVAPDCVARGTLPMDGRRCGRQLEHRGRSANPERRVMMLGEVEGREHKTEQRTARGSCLFLEVNHDGYWRLDVNLMLPRKDINCYVCSAIPTPTSQIYVVCRLLSIFSAHQRCRCKLYLPSTARYKGLQPTLFSLTMLTATVPDEYAALSSELTTQRCGMRAHSREIPLKIFFVSSRGEYSTLILVRGYAPGAVSHDSARIQIAIVRYRLRVGEIYWEQLLHTVTKNAVIRVASHFFEHIELVLNAKSCEFVRVGQLDDWEWLKVRTSNTPVCTIVEKIRSSERLGHLVAQRNCMNSAIDLGKRRKTRTLRCVCPVDLVDPVSKRLVLPKKTRFASECRIIAEMGAESDCVHEQIMIRGRGILVVSGAGKLSKHRDYHVHNKARGMTLDLRLENHSLDGTIEFVSYIAAISSCTNAFPLMHVSLDSAMHASVLPCLMANSAIAIERSQLWRISHHHNPQYTTLYRSAADLLIHLARLPLKEAWSVLQSSRGSQICSYITPVAFGVPPLLPFPEPEYANMLAAPCITVCTICITSAVKDMEVRPYETDATAPVPDSVCPLRVCGVVGVSCKSSRQLEEATVGDRVLVGPTIAGIFGRVTNCWKTLSEIANHEFAHETFAISSAGSQVSGGNPYSSAESRDRSRRQCSQTVQHVFRKRRWYRWCMQCSRLKQSSRHRTTTRTKARVGQIVQWSQMDCGTRKRSGRA